jgi:hypothetical protein
MATSADLEEWVTEALRELGGEAAVPRIAEQIWKKHEDELRKSGDLFFTWQYAMRWAGQRLQQKGKLKKKSRSWQLT